MAVVDTDIIVYGSANMQETDSGTQGGAIDTAVLIVFTDISPNGTTTIHSTNGGDTTQTVTVTGREADGTISSDPISLNGTTPVAGSTTFERILKVVMSATAVGTVVVEETTGGEDLVTMTPGVTSVRRPFYDVAAEASGGAARDYYEKIFFYNSNGSSALTSATIAEIAGGAAAQIDFDLESTLDGSNTSTNRITAPGGQTFNSTTKNVANSQSHSPTSGQGVWIHLALPAGEAANNTTYTLRESGQTV
jgi:hypothetical protein